MFLLKKLISLVSSIPKKGKKMKKLFAASEIITEDDGKVRISGHQTQSFETQDEAVAYARKKATQYVGDTYGVFELTGTVIHPVPELDVTPVA